MGLRRINKLNTVEPGFTIDSQTSSEGGGLGKGGGKKGIIGKGRGTGGVGFSKEKDIGRVGSNKIYTIRMFRAKFGGDRTIDIEETKRERVFKGGRERRNLNRRKKRLSKGIASKELEARTRG